jgi:hypothetical protein
MTRLYAAPGGFAPHLERSKQAPLGRTIAANTKRRRGSTAVSEDGAGNDQTTQFHYHLELTPAQLKITHTALRSLLDDFGHDEPEVLKVIHEVLDKLPDEHAIRAIQLHREIERQLAAADGITDEPPPSAA